MAAVAAIPAWAIWTAIGASTVGGMFSGISQGKQNEKALKQRNKEHLASIAVQNKQMDQQSDQFRQMQGLKEKQNTESAPDQLMNTMNMIRGLGQQPTSSADSLKYFLS